MSVQFSGLCVTQKYLSLLRCILSLSFNNLYFVNENVRVNIPQERQYHTILFGNPNILQTKGGRLWTTTRLWSVVMCGDICSTDVNNDNKRDYLVLKMKSIIGILHGAIFMMTAKLNSEQ